jgi:hypothetical protein
LVSFAIGSLFAHLFSFHGIMLGLHGTHLGNNGATSMGMGIYGFQISQLVPIKQIDVLQ